MAFAFTVTGANLNIGFLKMAYGTFTSADGDVQATLGNATHGMDLVVGYQMITNDVGAQNPKTSVSSGEITVDFDDTKGSSGIWWVMGK